MSSWTDQDLEDARIRYQRNLQPLDPTGRMPSEGKPPNSPYTGSNAQRRPSHVAGEMNRIEARFAQEIEQMRLVGAVQEWRFEELTFKLAKGCRYTPDFAVLYLIDGAEKWTMYDVKARAGRFEKGKYRAEDDAKVKIKVAAKLWPRFKWCVVYPEKNGSWKEVQF